MMHRIRRQVAMIAIFVLAGLAFALIEVQCEVKDDGSFRGIERSVEFATGSELNSATNSFSFNNFDVYALLWFGEGQVAILEHDGFAVGISGEFDFSDLESLFRVFGEQDFTQVNGPDRDYSIACKNYGRWIDPRLN